MPSQRSTYKEERQINLSVISMKRKGESALVRGDHYKERFLKKSRDYTKLEQELDSVKQELEQYKKKEKEKNDKESDGDIYDKGGLLWYAIRCITLNLGSKTSRYYRRLS